MRSKYVILVWSVSKISIGESIINQGRQLSNVMSVIGCFIIIIIIIISRILQINTNLQSERYTTDVSYIKSLEILQNHCIAV